MHLSSSQAPLVAGVLTHRGRSRHSYWLILGDLVGFKWITKSGAWQTAKCMVSLLSVTVSRDFLRARPSHFSQNPKLFFIFYFFRRLSWERVQFIKLKTSLVNRTPISVCRTIYCMAADEMQRWIRGKSSKMKSMQAWSVFIYLFGRKCLKRLKKEAHKTRSTLHWR